MLNYLKKFSPGSLLAMLLAIFTIINPNTGLDILAFLLICFIILQKIFGEYFVLILLAARPVLDYWRDTILFSFRAFDFNINAALSIFLLAWSAYFFIFESSERNENLFSFPSERRKYVAKPLLRNSRHFKNIPLKTVWLIFIAWASLSAIYSYDLASTIRETMKAANLFGLFGICYIMSIKDGPEFKKRFLQALIAGAIIPLLAAVYQLFSHTGMDIDDIANRIYGTFAHPNILATYALLLLAVLINELLHISNNASQLEKIPVWSKWLALFLLGIIAFTYTRIAWIGVVILFAVIWLVYYKKLLTYFLASIIIFYALFYPVNNYLISSYNFNLQSSGLISRLTSRNEDSDSIKWRTDLANKVLPLFTKKPILGYGYGSFPKVWDDNKDITNLWDTTSEAHNDYIKIAFESGIIGLILFLGIFINLLYNQISFAVKNKWTNVVFIASIAIYLVLSLSDNMLHHTPMIWWLWAVWGWWSSEYRLKKEEI